MPRGKSKKDKERIKKELEAVEDVMTLNKLIKKDDLEGVFISNPAKESETISDDVSNRIINALEKEGNRYRKKSQKIIDRIAGISTSSKGKRSILKVKKKSRTVKKRHTVKTKKAKKAKKTKIKKNRRR